MGLPTRYADARAAAILAEQHDHPRRRGVSKAVTVAANTTDSLTEGHFNLV